MASGQPIVGGSQGHFGGICLAFKFRIAQRGSRYEPSERDYDAYRKDGDDYEAPPSIFFVLAV